MVQFINNGDIDQAHADQPAFNASSSTSKFGCDGAASIINRTSGPEDEEEFSWDFWEMSCIMSHDLPSGTFCGGEGSDFKPIPNGGWRASTFIPRYIRGGEGSDFKPIPNGGWRSEDNQSIDASASIGSHFKIDVSTRLLTIASH